MNKERAIELIRLEREKCGVIQTLHNQHPGYAEDFMGACDMAILALMADNEMTEGEEAL